MLRNFLMQSILIEIMFIRFCFVVALDPRLFIVHVFVFHSQDSDNWEKNIVDFELRQLLRDQSNVNSFHLM